MSSLEVNKIAGAIIGTLLFAVVVGFIGDALVSPVQRPAPFPEVTAKESTSAAMTAGPAESQEPLAALLASADVEKGEKLFKKCAACHTVDNGGKNRVGPNLWNIVNAERGKKAGFSYSNPLTAMAGNWSYESLNAFLAKPKDYIKGTKMAFSGIKKATDRAAVIAYLRSLSDAPAPLP